MEAAVANAALVYFAEFDLVSFCDASFATACAHQRLGITISGAVSFGPL